MKTGLGVFKSFIPQTLHVYISKSNILMLRMMWWWVFVWFVCVFMYWCTVNIQSTRGKSSTQTWGCQSTQRPKPVSVVAPFGLLKMVLEKDLYFHGGQEDSWVRNYFSCAMQWLVTTSKACHPSFSLRHPCSDPGPTLAQWFIPSLLSAWLGV